MVLFASAYAEFVLSKKFTLVSTLINSINSNGFADLYIETIDPVATGASLYKENTDWYSDGKYKTITVPTKTFDAVAQRCLG